MSMDRETHIRFWRLPYSIRQQYDKQSIEAIDIRSQYEVLIKAGGEWDCWSFNLKETGPVGWQVSAAPQGFAGWDPAAWKADKSIQGAKQ